MHQTWLNHITGAKVIVIPSAENSSKFQFGLNFVSPIVAEIGRLKPTKVHLVGFSMGALAASAVGQRIDNGKLYLVAPMIDFEYSTNAIYNALYKNKFYTSFISQNTLDDAIQIVYEKAGMTPKDTNLLQRLYKAKSPAFIYTSTEDKVVDATALSTLSNSNVELSIYDDLSHLEMVALFRNDLLIKFVSDLLGRQVPISEITTLGVLCNFDDTECLDQIPN
jgi:esterase/lipase